MTMPRLIDDQRRRRAKWILSILAVAVLFALCVWIKKLYVLNEQYRMEGVAVLNDLQKKIDWLSSKTYLSEDAKKLEDGMLDITKCLEREVGVTPENVSFVSRTRAKQFVTRTTELTGNCQKMFVELTVLRKRLSDLSAEGGIMKSRLCSPEHSEVDEKIRHTLYDAEFFFPRLNRICKCPIVLVRNYPPYMKECRRIIEATSKLDEICKTHDEAHKEYVAWSQFVEASLKRFDELDNALNENYKELVAIKLEPDILEAPKKRVQEEVNAADTSLAKGKELCASSGKRLGEEMRKKQMVLQGGLDTLNQWKEQYSPYIESSNIEIASKNLEAFNSFCLSSNNNLEERIQRVVEKSSIVREASSTGTKTLVSLQGIVIGEIPDEMVVQQGEAGMKCANDLQKLRVELDKTLASLEAYLAEIQSHATEYVNDSTRLLNSVLEGAGHKVNMALTETKLGITKVERDLVALQNSFEYYLDERNSGKMAILQATHGAILSLLDRAKELSVSIRGCASEKELMELIQRRESAKKQLEGIEQKYQALCSEFRAALVNREIYEIEYVPFSAFASEFQKESYSGEQNDKISNYQREKRFELYLDIPKGGYHKVEIRFVKLEKRLFNSHGHRIIAGWIVSGTTAKIRNVIPYKDCELLEKNDNSGKVAWKDLSKSCSWGIILEDYFRSGNNRIVLDLSFSVKDILKKGNWQFLFKNNENITVEAMVDGVVKSFLVRKRK